MEKKRIVAKPKRKKPGRQIVRAWFDTVINPLLRSLDIERTHLAVKDWTWRFRPSGFEVLHPISSHTDVIPDNLEQFLQFHPHLDKLAQQHDGRLADLLKKCSELQAKLEESPELLEVYEKVTSSESLSRIRSRGGIPDEYQKDEHLIARFFGAYPKSDHLALLAQLIVNRTGELQSYHTTAPLWNTYKDEFLAIINRPSLEPYDQAAQKAGQDLLEIVHRLVHDLKSLREQLSLEYDEPPVATLTRSDARYF